MSIKATFVYLKKTRMVEATEWTLPKVSVLNHFIQ